MPTPGFGAPSANPDPRGARSASEPVPVWAEALARLLDRAFVIPGTEIGIGLDAILGFFAPGAGDAAGALATLLLVYLGFKLRVPKVILLRMLLNVSVDAVVGAVPIAGDLFDVYYHAGDRNLALLRKHSGSAGLKPDLLDYAIVALALLVGLALFALPLLAGLALIHIAARLSGF